MGGRIEFVENIRKLVGCAEEKWAVDSIDRRVGRDVFALEDMLAAILDVVFGDARDGGRPRNLADEHERS